MNQIDNASAYKKAEAYIYNIPKFTKKNSLVNTKRLLEVLGNPAMNKKIIHVAGTNGKGSVCAYLNGFLLENHKNTGMFTSPHLVCMTERIRLNGLEVSQEQFLSAYGQVLLGVEKAVVQKTGINHPTFFEILFLIAMVIFDESDVEYIILETGLGGRLDSTNVIGKPLLTIITRIGLDHCQYLGSTKEEIAGEKAGIIKPGVPVIAVAQEDNVTNVIRDYAKKMGCSCCFVDGSTFHVEKFIKKNIDFSYKSRYYGYISFTVPSMALYQAENISLALKGFEMISEPDSCQPKLVQNAISKVKWEGRMEEIEPGIIADGAHNEDGIRFFLQTVSRITCEGRRFLLFSVVDDKDYTVMVQLLAQSNLFDCFVAVSLQDERGLSIEKLSEKFMECGIDNAIYFTKIEEAYNFCRNKKQKEDAVYIAGSLYLIGSIKAVLRRNNND